jgi:hypothetical protein
MNVSDKHSILLDPFESYKENEAGDQYTALISNIRLDCENFISTNALAYFSCITDEPNNCLITLTAEDGQHL